jgi:hypothetical protein
MDDPQITGKFMNTFFLSLSLLFMPVSYIAQDDRILFDGVSLDHWEVISYEGRGEVFVSDSSIVIGRGELISGIRWTGDFPRSNYEVTFSAKRVDGHDFFCGMTFPVKESYLTLVLGGWGGAMTGLSCIDGYDAANNFTGKLFYFGSGSWWKVRLRVTDDKVEAWAGGDKIVDFVIGNSRLSLRSEVEDSKPFGFTTYKTTGAIRDIRLHRIGEN